MSEIVENYDNPVVDELSATIQEAVGMRLRDKSISVPEGCSAIVLALSQFIVDHFSAREMAEAIHGLSFDITRLVIDCQETRLETAYDLIDELDGRSSAPKPPAAKASGKKH